MKYLAPEIVKALHTLSTIPVKTLSQLAYVSQTEIKKWLAGEDHEVSSSSQLEIMKLLGINQGVPRTDVVHHWKIHESLGSNESLYDSLSKVATQFGGADTIYLSSDVDPVFSFKSKTLFILKFSEFYAVLEVTANPLKPVSLNPDKIEGLEWLRFAPGVSLNTKEFNELKLGALDGSVIGRAIEIASESAKWSDLVEILIEEDIKAEDVFNSLSHRLKSKASEEFKQAISCPSKKPTAALEFDESPSLASLIKAPIAESTFEHCKRSPIPIRVRRGNGGLPEAKAIEQEFSPQKQMAQAPKEFSAADMTFTLN